MLRLGGEESSNWPKHLTKLLCLSSTIRADAQLSTDVVSYGTLNTHKIHSDHPAKLEITSSDFKHRCWAKPLSAVTLPIQTKHQLSAPLDIPPTILIKNYQFTSRNITVRPSPWPHSPFERSSAWAKVCTYRITKFSTFFVSFRIDVTGETSQTFGRK